MQNPKNFITLKINQKWHKKNNLAKYAPPDLVVEVDIAHTNFIKINLHASMDIL